MKAFAVDAAALTALFLLVTGIASLLGATDLGTAAAFGQIAFMLGLVYVLLRR